MRTNLLVVFSLGVLIAPSAGLAGSGNEILKSQCASCHAIGKPTSIGLDHIWQRKAPDLYYAGSKFNKPWLAKWLQNPTRIRAAGEMYSKHVKGSDKEDVVDESSLLTHLKLTKDDAEAVTESLMAMTAPDGMIERNAFKGEKVNPTMGSMFFNKLRGCNACHMAKPGTGGVSGPELYTAGERLQTDYIYSYIKNPQKIDPHVWMPTLNLAEPDLQRLTGYIIQLNATEGK